MEWPADADGDVMRRLEGDGCDFTQLYPVEFQIDFEDWPPSQEALLLLNGRFGSVSQYDPEGGGSGYVQCTIASLITYEFVVRTQHEITSLMKPFGGNCESWGVFI